MNPGQLRIAITGASSGIGSAISEALSNKGHRVLGLARRFTKLPTEFHSSSGDQCINIACDVTQWDQVDSIARIATESWPCFDVLICCAATQGQICPTLTSNPHQWLDTVQTNLTGTYFPIRAFAPLLRRATRRAKILCFSGGGASRARPNFSAYAASKTAVVRLVETIASENENQPIDINAIAPGAIPTFMTDSIIAAGPDLAGAHEHRAAITLKESGSDAMQRALALVEWLISPASDGISGRLISAAWDPWHELDSKTFEGSDTYKLRRVLPAPSTQNFSDDHQPR